MSGSIWTVNFRPVFQIATAIPVKYGYALLILQLPIVSSPFSVLMPNCMAWYTRPLQ